MADRGTFIVDTNKVRDLHESNLLTTEQALQEMDRQDVDHVSKPLLDDTVDLDPDEELVNRLIAQDVKRVGLNQKCLNSSERDRLSERAEKDPRRAWQAVSNKCDVKRFKREKQTAETDATLIELGEKTGGDVWTSDKTMLGVCQDRLGTDRCYSFFEA